ncbi:7-carboxy-7-deazaguanine synthase [Luteitalea sp. TBR-22]|uniref:radical SAM protein n=1 Tax=Luteitalea sp. TBR-22 TaxID=2802971 RepID=UPI001AF0354B|nr:radical SAM protein [Luteitalea sp. TBR-22]BCS31498.1 7-carboxy-7-deazaguanine synthase [Luteitalea sp. TBR-22]
MSAPALTITEIYPSIQGESTFAGQPCTFVRLTACDLRCRWCDTVYAFTEGRKQSVEDVLAEVRAIGLPLVELTGGEPLLQKQAIPLMQALIDEGYTVLLETGGHVPIGDVPAGVHRIVDVKCPGSGEAERMHWPNLDMLTQRDEVKFVIADRLDFDYARDVVTTYDLAARCRAVHLSPAWGLVPPADLAAWILESRLPVRLQLQQHKYVWEPSARRV